MSDFIKALKRLFNKKTPQETEAVKEKIREEVDEILKGLHLWGGRTRQDIGVSFGTTFGSLNSEKIGMGITLTYLGEEKFTRDISIEIETPLDDDSIERAIGKFRADVTEAYNGIERRNE